MTGFDCDYLVVASGFGVSAPRLVGIGYRVIVLEQNEGSGPRRSRPPEPARVWVNYETAKGMLGRALNPSLTEMDDDLRATADAMSGGDTFGPEALAILFGGEGETVPDPFFGGDGPPRRQLGLPASHHHRARGTIRTPNRARPCRARNKHPYTHSDEVTDAAHEPCPAGMRVGQPKVCLNTATRPARVPASARSAARSGRVRPLSTPSES